MNKCYNCFFFNRYYTKGVKQYNKTKMGFCGKKNSDVNVQQGCDEFALKKRMRKSNRLACCYLSNLLTEISEMRKVIEDNYNEEL